METITVHQRFGKAVLKEIAIALLHSSAYQPRDNFSEEGLESLSKTVAQLGVLEPLIVRASPKTPDHFEIIAGERRWRAAKLSGLTEVPCLVSNYSDEQAAQVALIENTAREALNPIAEALAIQRLTIEFRYTHDEVATLLGMSRVHVTNLLRLLNLDARIQHWMKQGHLSIGHGKLLAGQPLEKQYWYAYEAIKKCWSVHVLEQAVKALDEGKNGLSKRQSTAPNSLFEGEVSEKFGYPVKVSLNKNETGYFRIHFHDREHMQKILEKLGCSTLEPAEN
jgi:ParB family chromosome partitioning protein